MSIKLIIGLGNPGPAYEATRHNAGVWFIQALLEHYKLSMQYQKNHHAQIATISIANQSCLIAIPTTFMNESGLPVRMISDYYKIAPDEILVAHDEMALEVGRVKLKTGGGHAGHNGLRNIISHLNTPDFHRLRLGIGHPGHKDAVLNYVLGKPSLSDQKNIKIAIESAIDILPCLLSNGMAKAMNQLHSG
jgi:PTH1 family peptidyl-tRNA hydrolase